MQDEWQLKPRLLGVPRLRNTRTGQVMLVDRQKYLYLLEVMALCRRRGISNKAWGQAPMRGAMDDFVAWCLGRAGSSFSEAHSTGRIGTLVELITLIYNNFDRLERVKHTQQSMSDAGLSRLQDAIRSLPAERIDRAISIGIQAAKLDADMKRAQGIAPYED